MKNAFQKIDIKDLVIVVGGSIDSSVGYGVGVAFYKFVNNVLTIFNWIETTTDLL